MFPEEWDARRREVVGKRARDVAEGVRADMARLCAIVGELDREPGRFTPDDAVRRFRGMAAEPSFFRFMEGLIARLRLLGKERSAETHRAALNSFARFRGDRDVRISDIDSDLMAAYEAYLTGRNVSMNTVSFYNRVLRAAYNRAVERGLTEQRSPFRHVYTGVGKTVKRAIPLQAVRRIKEQDLSGSPSLEFARDMFMFSFYARGMSFVDMAYARRTDLRNGVLSYCRRKTGQRLHVKWEKCMQEIVDRYPPNAAGYLLPIIRKSGSERTQYRNAMRLVNNKLKEIARITGIRGNLTMYVSRHSWASIARSQRVPLAVISEGMGHDSEKTTRIYLASLDHSAVDKANNLIIGKLG